MWMCSADPGASAGRFAPSIAFVLRAIPLLLALSVPVGAQATGSQAGSKPQAPPAADLAAVLARAGEAATAYAEHARTIIADERCNQRQFDVDVQNRPTPAGMVLEAVETTTKKREWKAELVMIPTPDLVPNGYPWLELRNVVEVDRAPLGDHPRLQEILRDASWQAKAGALHEASSAYNLGGARSFNTPAAPMLVLHPANQSRFGFVKAGEDKVEGTRTWRIEFDERHSPTLMRASAAADAPVTGVLWIDPGTGELVRGTLRSDVTGVRSELTITYRRQPGHAPRLPYNMQEKVIVTRTKGGIEANYSYTGFRALDTAGRVSPPK